MKKSKNIKIRPGFDEFLYKIQQPKMKELCDNKEDTNDADLGELSEQTKKAIHKARRNMKCGKYVNDEEVTRHLGYNDPIKPEYVKKIDRIQKQKGTRFKSISEFRTSIDNSSKFQVAVFGKKYVATVETDKDGWFVSQVAGLAGCHTQAKTMEQLIDRTKDAIKAYLSKTKWT